MRRLPRTPTAHLLTALISLPAIASAQTPDASSAAATRRLEQRVDELTQEVDALKKLVHELQEQLTRTAPAPTSPAPAVAAAPPPQPTTLPQAPAPTGGTPAAAPAQAAATNLPLGVTVNALLDGYYEYNFNQPIGRVNYLRAYDVSSNSFSLNQAALVVESAADVTSNKRWGMRLDFQFGQATSTLQGNPANELRPDVYRNIFQAYGTYVFPLAEGLTIDFGKWASSIGIEGNYTKDQLNYSRSFWFDFLPFYHMGFRSKLQINDLLALNLWIVNGAEQTEDFNNYKDQMYGFVLTPTPAISWTVNYYQGQEHPDVLYLQSQPAGLPALPNQQGTYILPITNPPTGKLEIFDTYATWQMNKALLLAAGADYVQQRLYSNSSPLRVYGGALYAGYQISTQIAVAARAEYLADIGGLYSGVTQYLKEGTLTLDYRPSDGFLVRGEYRRDQSNRPYFISSTLGILESAQPTLGIGLVWWFGQKQGVW
jgi:Putative beta-barrel porin-2, OmpL-like. bbp2